MALALLENHRDGAFMLSKVSPIVFLIATLAVWRITHLLWGEDGPWDIFVRLRRLVGQGFLGSLLDCFYCLSLWIAIAPGWLLGRTWVERILLWLALSAGAILLERISGGQNETEEAALQAQSENPAAVSVPESPTALWHKEPLEGDPRKEN